MNTLSKYKCFYISKNITSHTFVACFLKPSKAFSVFLIKCLRFSNASRKSVQDKRYRYNLDLEPLGLCNSELILPLSICKILNSQETDRPWTDRTEQYASKKSVLNEKIKKIHSRKFQGLKEDQKNSISKFR